MTAGNGGRDTECIGSLHYKIGTSAGLRLQRAEPAIETPPLALEKARQVGFPTHPFTRMQRNWSEEKGAWTHRAWPEKRATES